MYGSLEQHDDLAELHFTRHLPHPPEKVWRALTEDEHLAAWFPCRLEGERAAGATLRYQFDQEGAPEMAGEMLVYDPPKVLELTWGDDTLRFELEPDGDGTTLHLVDSFPELGKAARDGAGWHSCLDALASDLAGEPVDDERWKAVLPWYREHLPPEASTIGPPEWHDAAG
jgi:uncharacterized protein YndB with AHSA1/START domain